MTEVAPIVIVGDDSRVRHGIERLVGSRGAGHVFAVLGIAAVTAICVAFHETIKYTPVALAFLLGLLFVATGWGSRPAMVASMFGIVAENGPASRSVESLISPKSRDRHLEHRGNCFANSRVRPMGGGLELFTAPEVRHERFP